MQHPYIAIEGNIGSGKTTLAGLLAERLGAKTILEEFAENEFLPKFYAEPERYALPLELSFLTDRYRQLQEHLFESEEQVSPIVSDYIFSKSKLFAAMNLATPEFELFSRVFELMTPQIRKPDVLVFLKAGIPLLQQRIQQRGRGFESGIPDEYLEKVEANYDEFLKSVGKPVVMIDSSRMDFSKNSADLDLLSETLSKTLEPVVHYPF